MKKPAIAVIGTGSIGSYVCRALRKDDLGPAAVIVRSAPRGEPVPGLAYVTSVGALPAEVGLVVDCAGHSGLSAHGAAALSAGIDVVTLSLGALADEALSLELQAAAVAGQSRLHLASGAIGGLDALRAGAVGGLDRVVYTGRKPPAGWIGSPAGEVLDLTALTRAEAHFEGSARAAALRYPKNANVAAAVALAGLGFDRTEARLIADPGAAGNFHEVEAEGAFGRFRFEISGTPLPDNPRSSALAAMSAVAEVLRLRAPMGF